jgi:hypothetical protein
MSPKDLQQFGRHTVWTDAPDVLRVQFDGPVLGRDLRATLDYRNDWAQGRGRYFVIADLTTATSVDSEARQVMVEERAAVDRRQVTILFGADFGIRVIAQMMFRSLRVLRPNVEHAERIFVPTEADALAYVEKNRKDVRVL